MLFSSDLIRLIGFNFVKKKKKKKKKTLYHCISDFYFFFFYSCEILLNLLGSKKKVLKLLYVFTNLVNGLLSFQMFPCSPF